MLRTSLLRGLILLGLVVPQPILVGCGGGEPDYESCSKVGGKTYCCRTYCSSDGKKCTTECT